MKKSGLAFDLIDAAFVTTAFEVCIEPDVDDFERQIFGDWAPAD